MGPEPTADGGRRRPVRRSIRASALTGVVDSHPTCPTPKPSATTSSSTGPTSPPRADSLPSLAQLDEAVRAFLEEYPDVRITAVVDATFAHRIDASEKPRYEQAILDGDLVAPPAGAVGRGDAFVLAIAHKASATILSNDSFQEFHGEYPWVFDEGRLIGGKPVDGVGWVFVVRSPVRGPLSRRSQRSAAAVGGGRQSKGSEGRGAKAVEAEVARRRAGAGRRHGRPQGRRRRRRPGRRGRQRDGRGCEPVGPGRRR